MHLITVCIELMISLSKIYLCCNFAVCNIVLNCTTIYSDSMTEWYHLWKQIIDHIPAHLWRNRQSIQNGLLPDYFRYSPNEALIIPLVISAGFQVKSPYLCRVFPAFCVRNRCMNSYVVTFDSNSDRSYRCAFVPIDGLVVIIMTSYHGNALRIAGQFSVESTDDMKIPLTKGQFYRPFVFGVLACCWHEQTVE